MTLLAPSMQAWFTDRLINQRDEIVVEGRHVYRILCRTPAR